MNNTNTHSNGCPCCGEQMLEGFAIQCSKCDSLHVEYGKTAAATLAAAMQLGWTQNGDHHFCPKCSAVQ